VEAARSSVVLFAVARVTAKLGVAAAPTRHNSRAITTLGVSNVRTGVYAAGSTFCASFLATIVRVTPVDLHPSAGITGYVVRLIKGIKAASVWGTNPTGIRNV
jgi:hypothetical protein